MSPEQAAGKRAVPASDQFSLGTILYEMVTGRQAWKRSTAAETLTAIIREDPPPIASAAPDTPMALRWIIERCLAKDPEERYGSTRDLARDLATLRNHLGELSGADLPAAGAGGLAPRPRGRRNLLIAVACAAVIGAVILLLPSPPIRKTAPADWTRIGSRRGIVWSGRFAPDGQTILYSAAWDGDPGQIYSTRPGSTQTRALDLPPGKLLAISAKSELLFQRDVRFHSFFSQSGTLVRAPLEGVGRDILGERPGRGLVPDGTQLAVAREVAGKVRLEYPLGKTLFETDRRIGSVRISRDGAWIAFCEGGGEVTIEALRVSDGQRRVLSEGWFPGGMGLAWSADGREIWFTPQKQVRDSSPPLLAVTLAGKLREVVRGPGQLRLYDIAADGRLLLARWDLQVGARGISPGSTQESELSVTDDSSLADLSADGSAVLLYDRDGLFLRRTDGSPAVRLSERFDGGRLSPDGKSILVISPWTPARCWFRSAPGKSGRSEHRNATVSSGSRTGNGFFARSGMRRRRFAFSKWRCRPEAPPRFLSHRMRRRTSTIAGRFRRTEPSSPASGTAGTTGSFRWRAAPLGESPRVSPKTRSRSDGPPTAGSSSFITKARFRTGFRGSISQRGGSSPGKSSI